MVDKTLHGNGFTCPACQLRHQTAPFFGTLLGPTPCNFCDGTGRLPRQIEDIIAGQIAEARKHHWKDAQ